MLDQDKKHFAEIYRGVCANYGREASTDAMRLTWAALHPYDIGQVQQAYTSHVMTSRFMPNVADILEKISHCNPSMQRLGADEAFALMPRSEDDSVVWTEEMAYAWSVASHHVNEYEVARPDWVAARMAFKDAYNRAVDASRAQNKPVKWTIARGHQNDNLEDVITEAVRLGRMTRDDATPHLRELEYVRPINNQLLLEGAAQANEDARDAAMAAVAAWKELVNPAKDIEAFERDLQEARAHCYEADKAA